MTKNNPTFEHKVECVYRTLINSIWFTEYVMHEDHSVTILKHERDYRNYEKGMVEGWCVEDERRTVIRLKVGEKSYPVRNPQYVFSYR